jgi:hypothetical protein
MSITIERPDIEKTVSEQKRKDRRLKSIKHIQDPRNPERALCTVKIDTKGVSAGTDPCVVCLQMKNNSRRWER